MYGGNLVNWNTKFTWIVLVLCKVDDRNGRLCSGSVIHPRWVLTAAHCLRGDSEVTSATDVTINVYRSVGIFSRYEVRNVFVYEEKRSEGNDRISGDIGLIQTKWTLKTGLGKMNIDPSFYPSDECSIVGFGRKGVVEESVPTMHYMKVKVFPKEGCRRLSWNRDSICLMILRGIGPCVGDSGSPLICDGLIAGVLSDGRLQGPPVCDSTTNGAVFYEPASQYVEWITAVQRDNPGDSAGRRGSECWLVALSFIAYLIGQT